MERDRATPERDDAPAERTDAAPAALAGPTVRSTPVLNPQTVLALQRAGGNRQVSALIARDTPDGGTAVASPAGGVARDIFTLITEGQWAEVVSQLSAMTDERMNEQLRLFRRVDLEEIKNHASGNPRVQAAAETARVRQLGLDYDDAVRGGRWEEAVRLVQAYNDIDLPLKLDLLDFDQIAALCLQADRMLPGYQRVRTAAEPLRVRKLGEAYEAAVNGSLWPRAILLLGAYNDTDLLPKARMIKAKGDPQLAAAAAAAATQWPDDNHRVRRTLSFLGVENLTGAAVRPASAPPITAGTAEPGVAVPETGGTVSYSGGNQLGSTGQIYGLSYTGADAQKTGWIQFIARNIEKFDAAGKSLGFHTGSWTPSGQGARNFSSTGTPVWFLDTLSNQAPFYEAASTPGGSRGLSAVSATNTTMYDRPSGRVDIVAPLFADPAVKSVKSRAMFDTYLVQEMQVLRRETVTSEFTYTPAMATAGTDPTPVTTHTGGGQVSSMPADRFRAMTARFPNFAYLPHG